MARSLVVPWASEWWQPLEDLAVRGGSKPGELKEKIEAGHAMIWPVESGHLVISRTEDDFLLVWLCVGKNVRDWWRSAEHGVSALARSVGCKGLRLEGRRGWRKILPHWTPVGDEDLVLILANEG